MFKPFYSPCRSSLLQLLIRSTAMLLIASFAAAMVMTPVACTAPKNPARAIDPGFSHPQALESAESPLKRKILARGDHAYAPFEFVDESGMPAGFNVDLLWQVGAIMNLDIEIVLGPWDEVRSQLEHNEIDMLPGMYKTPGRDLLVDFTIPHFISSYGIFAEHDSGMNGAEDLADKRVAVQAGDVGHDYLVEQGLAGELVIFNRWEDIFIAVLQGEADCAVASMIQGSRLIQDRRYATLRQIGPPLIQQRYCMAVTKGDAELLAALNEGLSILKANGEYDRIYEKWFGVYEDELIKTQKIYRNLMLALATALVTGLMALAWSAMLRRQVFVKTQALTRELALNEENRGKLALALESAELSRKEAEQAQSEAEQARHEAEEASRAKSVFLASISHELRTPLHGVIGISHLLERSSLDDDQRRLLGMLSGAAGQLERLITDLLDLTRSATGTLSLNPVAFRLGELPEWMEKPLSRQAEAKGLTLHFDISQPDLQLVADKERLAQIVVNLASNSIKFTEKGGIAVSLGLKAGQLALEVSDTGSGIPESEREHVFESFYQLDNGPAGGLHSGLGLGLAIVRMLVQLMEGTITISDKPGGGSVFAVFLPFTPAPPEPVTETAKVLTAAVLNRGHTENRKGCSVLVVEDEAINRMYIQRLLKEQGMMTTGVGDGESAVAAASTEPFNLILMDLGLPKLSGLEATRAIRQAESASGRPRTLIAALTANAYPQDKEECIKAGMDDFISKPFEEKGFWRVLDRLLGPSATIPDATSDDPSVRSSADSRVNPSDDLD
jgi:signal transduction histidine kinase/FixJ family two-component response regulator